VFQVHLNDICSVVVRAKDIVEINTVQTRQPSQLLALQVFAVAMVVVVPHQHRVWLDVLAVQPLHGHCVIHDWASREDGDVVLAIAEQVFIADLVEATERVVIMVPLHRILLPKVDVRDAPLVVSYAVV
jgi:phosphoketolase